MASSQIQCTVCLEDFVRDLNPPMSCVPCGHVICEPCLASWRRSLPYFSDLTCPICRGRVRETMMNRSLMDVLEDQASGRGLPRGLPVTMPDVHLRPASQGASAADGSPASATFAPPGRTSSSTAATESDTANPGGSTANGRPSTSSTASTPSGTRNTLVQLPDGSSITLSNTLQGRKQTMAHELLPEKSCVCFYVIDNSGSMGRDDGKKFETVLEKNAWKLVKRGHGSVTRWEEAAAKCMQIAVYNLRRKMRASYYLLNPSTARTQWIDELDQVLLDATDCNLTRLEAELAAHFAAGAAGRTTTTSSEPAVSRPGVQLLPNLLWLVTSPAGVRTLCECLTRSGNEEFGRRLNVLYFNLLSSGSIRGSTPLHSITQYLSRELETMTREMNLRHALPINMNLITDGEPDNRIQFENQLKKLCNEFRSSLAIMLTINLCTDDDDVVDYYNELDKKLGNEINSLDVLDDLESEQKEVLKAGNTFVTYCEELHVCRMAGCNAVIADSIDEEELQVFHATKLARELLGFSSSTLAKVGSTVAADQSSSSGGAVNANSSTTSPRTTTAADPSVAYQCGEDIPSWFDDTEDFLRKLEQNNRNVYDFYYKANKPLVNVGKVRNKIWWHKQKEGVSKFFGGFFGSRR
ncbi:unnamed protein product [Amoebophrya sp. A120]|nr:unnamed protein product [Amoebophrya sp. A120]|eukprot:GSA120T00005767001.1